MYTVLIVPAYDAGGISVYCATLGLELAKRGHPIRVVHWVDRGSPYSPKIQPALWGDLPRTLVEFDSLDKARRIGHGLARQLDLKDGDVLISQGLPWVAHLVQNVRKVKSIWHFEVIHDESGFFESRHAEIIQSTCDGLIAVSQRIARRLSELYPSIPVSVCPGGVAIPDTPIRVKPQELFGLCYVGRLDPIHKRILDFIPLVKNLATTDMDFRFHIIGSGNERVTLERAFTAAGLQDRVRFWGQCPHASVYAILKTCQSFVLPSAFEGFPLALCEAMACGLVPIATRVSGSEDAIASGVNGFLVDVGDVTAMTRAIVTLASDRSRFQEMSGAARATAVSQFALEKRADALLRAILQTVTTRQPREPLTIPTPHWLDNDLVPNALTRAIRRTWRRFRGRPRDAGGASERGSRSQQLLSVCYMCLSGRWKAFKTCLRRFPGVVRLVSRAKRTWLWSQVTAAREHTTLDILSAFPQFTPNSAGHYQDKAVLTLEAINATLPALSALLATTGSSPRSILVRDFLISNDGAAQATLKRLFDHYGSDKASIHDYHEIYARLFPDTASVRAILEIGIGTHHTDVISTMGMDGQPGASLRAFKEFFPNAMILGADVDERILFEETRIRTFYIDQRNPDTLHKIRDNLALPLDLVIDDGLHLPHANLASLQFGLSLIRPGGWVVIEDIAYAAIPLWEVVSMALPASYASYLIRARRGIVFAVRRGL